MDVVKDGFSCALTIVLMVMTMAIPVVATPTEYDVKAAFLYNFAKFVEWPPDTFKEPTAPLTVCVLGDDPFGEALEKEFSGKTVQDRPIVFEPLDHHAPAACQVLFVSASERKRVDAILQDLQGPPILTVSDIHRFVKHGGMIGFTLEDDRVRFEVNLAAAEQAGLKISSQLLKLAKNVTGKPRGT